MKVLEAELTEAAQAMALLMSDDDEEPGREPLQRALPPSSSAPGDLYSRLETGQGWALKAGFKIRLMGLS